MLTIYCNPRWPDFIFLPFFGGPSQSLPASRFLSPLSSLSVSLSFQGFPDTFSFGSPTKRNNRNRFLWRLSRYLRAPDRFPPSLWCMGALWAMKGRKNEGWEEIRRQREKMRKRKGLKAVQLEQTTCFVMLHYVMFCRFGQGELQDILNNLYQ